MAATAEIIQFNRHRGDSECPQEPKKGAQLEDGYTRIANELMDALMKAPLTSREARIMRAFERATFGWNRKAAWLAASVLADMTGMTAQNASKALNSLIRKKIIIRDGGSRSPSRINTRTSEWILESDDKRVSPKQSVKPKQANLAQNELTELAQNELTNKDRKDKDLSNDKSNVASHEQNQTPAETKSKARPDAAVQSESGKSWGTADDLATARQIADDVAKLEGGDKSCKTDQQLCSWANEIRKLRGRKTESGKPITDAHIRAVWAFANQDEFWRTNILSPRKLAEKWKQLAVKMRHGTGKGKGGVAGRSAYVTNFDDQDYAANQHIPDWMTEDDMGDLL